MIKSFATEFVVTMGEASKSAPFIFRSAFPLELDSATTNVRYETIKWMLAVSGKHEVHVPLLAKYELPDIVAHCVQVMFRVDAQVMSTAERYLSYMNVFPRTLPLSVLAIWDNVVAEHPLGAMNHNIAGFHNLIRLFIKVNATSDERRELVDFLRHARKPRTMGVGPFYFRLRELNEQVTWLPGTDAKLSNLQLDQAFHDGMPQAWQDRYSNAGRNLADDDHADLLRFFRTQQATAERSLATNVVMQQRNRRNGNGNNGNNDRERTQDRPVRFAVRGLQLDMY